MTALRQSFEFGEAVLREFGMFELAYAWAMKQRAVLR